MSNTNRPRTLTQAIRYFADPQTCIDTIAAMRWPDGPVCPACGHKDHYYLKTQRRWKCKECYKQFTVKLGTIFEDSAIPLDKWLIALWMLVNCKNGVSSYELHRSLGITQKSAWFVLQRLRLALRNGSIVKMGGEGGECEADEAFVGGKAKNMHKSRRLRLNQIRNAMMPDAAFTRLGKTAVMGMLDRDAREVRAMVIPNVKRETLQYEILKQIELGSNLYTDSAYAYSELGKLYAHEIVDHATEYVRGRVDTNGLENFWSLLKRTLTGTYVAVEPFHLERYVDEQVFRYNNRGSKKEKVTDADRFETALSQIAGKRLTYAEVTGKDATTPF